MGAEFLSLINGTMYFAHLRYLWVSKKLIKGATNLFKSANTINMMKDLRLEDLWKERDGSTLDDNQAGKFLRWLEIILIATLKIVSQHS
tara:strand:+ start:403 stop:669 length:267 start_codon:yes stop_codon:yes gene_type:complete